MVLQKHPALPFIVSLLKGPLLLVAVLFLFSYPLFPDVVHLSDGRTIDGEILFSDGYRLYVRQKTGGVVQLNIRNVQRIFYSDQTRANRRPEPTPNPNQVPPRREIVQPPARNQPTRVEQRQPEEKPVREERSQPEEKPVREEQSQPEEKPVREERSQPEEKPVREERSQPEEKPVREERSQPEEKPVREEQRQPQERPQPNRPAERNTQRPLNPLNPVKPGQEQSSAHPQEIAQRAPDRPILLSRDKPIELSSRDAEIKDPPVIYYAINDAPFQIYRSPFRLGDDGEYSVKYYAVDSAGNQEAVRIVKITLDTTPPLISFDFPSLYQSDSTKFTADASFRIRISDAISGLASSNCLINGREIRMAAGTDIPLQRGSNVLRCVATDRAGNVSRTQEIVSLDTAAPLLAFRRLERTHFGKNDTIGFSASDAGCGLRSLRIVVGETSRDLDLTAREIKPADLVSASGRVSFHLEAEDHLDHKTISETIEVEVDLDNPQSEIKIQTDSP